jgi:hypothetical protein
MDMKRSDKYIRKKRKRIRSTGPHVQLFLQLRPQRTLLAQHDAPLGTFSQLESVFPPVTLTPVHVQSEQLPLAQRI